VNDPEVLYGQLAAGDAGRIAAASDPISGAISAVGRSRDSVTSGGRTAMSNWTGASAAKFAVRAELSATSATVAGERLGVGVEVVQAASRAYSKMRGSADQVIAVWRGRSPLLNPRQTVELAQRVNSSLNEVKSGYEQVLRAYATALGQVKPGFEETAKADPGWAKTVAAMRTSPTVPGPGTDPKQVAAWWKSLTKEQQDELLRSKFQELGQLRGLPSGVLDQANRARISDDARRFGADRDRLDAAMAARAAELGIDPTTSNGQTDLLNDPRYASLMEQRQEAATKAENAAKAQHSVENAERIAGEKGWRISDVRVLSYDPYGPRGDGGMAIAYGDPDNAKNVAVCVPGTGSKLDNFGLDQSANLRAQMGAQGNATIQWLGYDAPDWSPGQVGSPELAKEGGRNLVADVNGYRAAAVGSQHITVIGHSYGSTTVGYAGLHGLAADDIAFVGSPGVGASNVNQLSVGPGHVYAGATEHDPVVQGTSSDWFTADGSSTGPYDKAFGAKVFGTTDSANLVNAHSNYYDPGSESVSNLSKIATGAGGSVTAQKWYDSPVGPSLPGSSVPGIGPVIDIVGDVGAGGADMVGGLATGGAAVVQDVFTGNWSEAGQSAANTGREFLNDAGDIVVGTVGNVAELGRDVYDGAAGAVKKIGSWF
jgi:hypothetical protein